LHEDLKREHGVKAGSERSFGFVFAGFFLIVALAPLFAGAALRVWPLAAAAAFLGIALLRPALLAPLNRVWLKFGSYLHKVVSPIVLGVLFFLVVAPTGLLMRVLGKDPLRLRLDRASRSYWIERSPPGPAPDTMRNQF
jgi:hypothetical protein